MQTKVQRKSGTRQEKSLKDQSQLISAFSKQMQQEGPDHSEYSAFRDSVSCRLANMVILLAEDNLTKCCGN